MSIVFKERIRNLMIRARDYSEKLLADFKTPEQWTHQVHEGSNHALWFAGHMAVADNFFIGLICPDKSSDCPEYQPLFGMGSTPTSNPGDYPPVEEVVSQMQERRAVLLDVLDGLSEDDFTKPTEKGAPDFLKDFASVFELAVWHEGIHSGQVSLVRRSLGHSPVMGGPPPKADALEESAS